MKKALRELWNVFIGSIRDIEDPIVKYVAGFALVLVTWGVIFSLSSLIVHGIIDIIEIIANAIISATTGVEVPKT